MGVVVEKTIMLSARLTRLAPVTSRSCVSALSAFSRNTHIARGEEDIFAPPPHDPAKNRPDNDSTSNRAFSYMMIGTAGFAYATAARAGVNDLLHTMNPSADVLALANIEVDLTTIPVGNSVTLKWRGKPLFVRHRAQEEIDEAVRDDGADLRDKEADADRVKDPEWLVLLGICTHLGCVPLNYSGDYKGFFCPCHGSHYDTSGRIRKGPAPLNLEVPPYAFSDDGKMVVGVDSLE